VEAKFAFRQFCCVGVIATFSGSCVPLPLIWTKCTFVCSKLLSFCKTSPVSLRWGGRLVAFFRSFVVGVLRPTFHRRITKKTTKCQIVIHKIVHVSLKNKNKQQLRFWTGSKVRSYFAPCTLDALDPRRYTLNAAPWFAAQLFSRPLSMRMLQALDQNYKQTAEGKLGTSVSAATYETSYANGFFAQVSRTVFSTFAVELRQVLTTFLTHSLNS